MPRLLEAGYRVRCYARSPEKLRDRTRAGQGEKAYYHLVLLARDLQGYQNLVKLVSIAHLEGVYYKPRIDKTLLRKYSKGLIGLSACLRGEVNEACMNGDIDRDAAVQWLVDYGLTSPERARQRTDFFDTYRSYVINYNHGKHQVKRYVEADDADLAERWQRFERILSGPFLPDML